MEWGGFSASDSSGPPATAYLPVMTIELERRRMAIVAEHIAAENARDVPRALRTFHRPRYEVLPLGDDPFAGAAPVEQLLTSLFRAFPDFAVRVRRTHHAASAVIVEAVFTATHAGGWAAIAQAGQGIDVPAVCIFDFEDDRLVCERVYFDHATLLRQLSA